MAACRKFDPAYGDDAQQVNRVASILRGRPVSAASVYFDEIQIKENCTRKEQAKNPKKDFVYCFVKKTQFACLEV
jgi:hypothetical protein